MEDRNCNMCRYSSLGVIEGGDQDGEPVLKCMRYPPSIFFYNHGDDEHGLGQANPEAVAICGEYSPVAGNTPPVIGTIRKVKDHAARISNRVIGHLHRGNRRHRSLQDSGAADQPQDGVGP